VRYERSALFPVDPRETGSPTVVVAVDMPHRDPPVVGNLKDLAETLGANHGADPGIVQVVRVVYYVILPRQHQEAIVTERGDSTGQKAHPLGSHGMRPGKVGPHALKEPLGDPEDNPH